MYLNLDKHERDERIVFEELPHIYYVDGVEYDTSVTSFVHRFFEQFDPIKVINKYYDIWQSNPNSPYFGLEPEDIMRMWEDNRDEASSQGTRMHKSIEKFYRGEVVEDSSPEFNQFLSFYEDNKDLIPLRQEWMVFDEDLEIAGSIDALFQDGEEYVIFDWKRSKAIKEQSRDMGYYPVSHLPNANFWHYSLQLNIYRYILEKRYGVEISGMRLGVFHPNKDEYDVYRVPDLRKEVDEMLNLRREEIKMLRE